MAASSSDPAPDSGKGHAEQTLRDIPAFPPVILRLLRELTRPGVRIAEVVDLLRSDTSLTADLLKRANSAYYGLPAKVEGLRQCLVLLGLDEVRRIALTIGASHYSMPARRLPLLRRCWRHSLASAMLAEEIAQVTGVEPDLAYTAGLLHDIGRIGLLAARPKRYSELLTEIERLDPTPDKEYLLNGERERFEVDHCEAGRWLAAQWRLPGDLGVIAGRHHDAPGGAGFDLLALVQLSCAMADHFGFAVLTNTIPASYHELLERLPGRARERFYAWPEDLAQRLRQRLREFDSDVQGAEEAEQQWEPLPLLDAAEEKPLGLTPAPEKKALTPSRWWVFWLLAALLVLAALWAWRGP